MHAGRSRPAASLVRITMSCTTVTGIYTDAWSGLNHAWEHLVTSYRTATLNSNAATNTPQGETLR